MEAVKIPGWKPAPVRMPEEPLENCPVCREWLTPIASGLVRQHPRSGPKCPGSGTEDTREYLVYAPACGGTTCTPTAYTVSGRRSAEIVAKKIPGAVVYERSGS